MHLSYTLTFFALIALSSARLSELDDNCSAHLLRRQSFGYYGENDAQTDYLVSVCQPPDVTSPVPPCTEIITLQVQCQLNGTDPVDYIAHQQCMCGGGYFSNWIGCLDCQYVHGAKSEAAVDAYQSILSIASSSLCTGTPTASFDDILSSVSEAQPTDTAGVTAATTTSDQFPSMSAVSLYYTASGPQGAGAITVSAASATATESISDDSGSGQNSNAAAGFASGAGSTASGTAASATATQSSSDDSGSGQNSNAAAGLASGAGSTVSGTAASSTATESTSDDSGSGQNSNAAAGLAPGAGSTISGTVASSASGAKATGSSASGTSPATASSVAASSVTGSSATASSATAASQTGAASSLDIASRLGVLAVAICAVGLSQL